MREEGDERRPRGRGLLASREAWPTVAAPAELRLDKLGDQPGFVDAILGLVLPDAPTHQHHDPFQDFDVTQASAPEALEAFPHLELFDAPRASHDPFEPTPEDSSAVSALELFEASPELTDTSPSSPLDPFEALPEAVKQTQATAPPSMDLFETLPEDSFNITLVEPSSSSSQLSQSTPLPTPLVVFGATEVGGPDEASNPGLDLLGVFEPSAPPVEAFDELVNGLHQNAASSTRTLTESEQTSNTSEEGLEPSSTETSSPPATHELLVPDVVEDTARPSTPILDDLVEPLTLPRLSPVQDPPSLPPEPPLESYIDSVFSEALAASSSSSRWRMEGDGGRWPHGLSGTLAALATTLGLFNISRFAILSVHLGGNFVAQFVVVSVVAGVPLFTYHMSLGQLLGAGPVDMWNISPLLKGVGVGVVVSQAMIGLYSVVPVCWLLVYLRDTFDTSRRAFPWALPFSSGGVRNSSSLGETVSDYFAKGVLERGDDPAHPTAPHLKFQLAVSLALLWFLVFLSLSKGLKSYGKVVFAVSLAPVFGMLVLCSKLLGLAPARPLLSFPPADWSDFLLDGRGWFAAVTEVFYTWGLFGATAKTLASHNGMRHALHRDTGFIAVLTLTVLLLAAFLANTCTQLLLDHGFSYIPSSFERRSSWVFLEEVSMSRMSSGRWAGVVPLVAGERVTRWGAGARLSGYQPVRLATELVPAALALLTPHILSPLWAALFYITLVLFAIAQQLAIMHCVITAVVAVKAKTMKHWRTTITFLACVIGFGLALPMATDSGISVVYLFEWSVGGGWALAGLYFAELVGVFVVRGRPCSGETVAATLLARAARPLRLLAAPPLSALYSLLLPIFLAAVCVSLYRGGGYRDALRGRSVLWQGESWPPLARPTALILQYTPLILVPLIALIQTFRYLSKGPPDLFDRLEQLWRPPMGGAGTGSGSGGGAGEVGGGGAASERAPSPVPPQHDPPPKYTPPPSYTTATGARIAKMLRQSFRRSMRRVTRTLGGGAGTVPPPSYATVLVELGRAGADNTGDSRPEQQRPVATPAALRHSFRRAMRQTLPMESCSSSARLVDSAAPINLDSLIVTDPQTKPSP